MKAKFIGTDSMGYIHGKEYRLRTFIMGGLLWIEEINGRGKPCPYKNIETFSNNWLILPKKEILNK